ncbi:MAG: Flp family type IVb pilin [Actinomycetota bacterium]
MQMFTYLESRLTELVDDDRGASLVEYALLLALLALVCIAAMTALGGTTSGSYSEITSLLD